MLRNFFILLLSIFISVNFTGCVKREIHISSEPAGAPVWIDEVFQGETPVSTEFVHYGYRNIRVGPVRDDKGRTEFMSQDFIYKVKAPWHQKFPLDFFTKVLWPFSVEDIHALDINLVEYEYVGDKEMDEKVREILRNARLFREKALHPPEDR